MRDATFDCCDLTTFCRLDGLGLEVVGQRVERDRALLACRVVEPDGWCRRFVGEGSPRDSVVRRLTHAPLGWRPTTLHVSLTRYRCAACVRVWRDDLAAAAEPRAKISRRGRPARVGGGHGRSGDSLAADVAEVCRRLAG